MAAQAQSFIFRDINKSVVRMLVWCADDTSALVVAGTLPDLTNSHYCAARGPLFVADDFMAGTADIYGTVQDKALFAFATAAGGRHNVEVPAPVEALFLGDLNTLDPTSPAVIAFSAAVKASCTSRDGDALTQYLGGHRLMRTRRVVPRVVVLP